MQASRPCVLLAPLQIRLDEELHHYVASRFLIDSVVLIKRFPSLNEMQLHPMVRTSMTCSICSSQFVLYVADNVHHNI